MIGFYQPGAGRVCVKCSRKADLATLRNTMGIRALRPASKDHSDRQA